MHFYPSRQLRPLREELTSSDLARLAQSVLGHGIIVERIKEDIQAALGVINDLFQVCLQSQPVPDFAA
jgi:hypothetical protein